MKFERQLRYYYLRFLRLRGEPHELALGVAFGVFAGMMPIMPFQIAVAVALALWFKGSKITAVLGTWISNPLNWYFLYYYNYKLGAFFLGIKGNNKVFSTVMSAIKSGGEPMAIVGMIFEASGMGIAAFLIGGLVMGFVAAVPVYFVFLPIFTRIRIWRRAGRKRRE